MRIRRHKHRWKLNRRVVMKDADVVYESHKCEYCTKVRIRLRSIKDVAKDIITTEIRDGP